jgi:repressor LexA
MQMQFSAKELETLKVIRNTLNAKGRVPSVRELMAELGYRSPRSAAVLMEQLEEKGVLKRRADGSMVLIEERTGSDDANHAQTVTVPLVGAAACGLPIMAEENVEALIPVSVKLARPPHKYFLLRAQGTSMDEKDIDDGDLVLVRQQPTADNGDLVVALIDDHATIKEFHRSEHAVVLKPRSSDPKHKPIILTDDFRVQGIVVAAIGKL